MRFKNIILLILLCFASTSCRTPLYQAERPLEQIPPIDVDEREIRLALVLGGGGSRGMFHVGVLEIFEEENIPIDLIVGCSAGSIVGALYADTPDAKCIGQKLVTCKRKDLVEIDIFSCLFGLCHGKGLTAFLDRNLCARQFEELQIPFVLVATDLESGELVSIGSGPIIPAVHASCAVPFVFKPVHLYGRVLVDGGVIDPNPVKTAMEYNPKIIVAVDLTQVLPKAAPRSLFGIAKRSCEIAYISHCQECLKGADVVIRPDLGPIGMFDDNHNAELYEAGKEAARKVLPQIQELYDERVLLPR